MAAWTLPNRIADWFEILTTAFERRSRKYLVTIILRMVLARGFCCPAATVPFGVQKGPFRQARFGSKLSESLVAEGCGVNRPFLFGLLV